MYFPVYHHYRRQHVEAVYFFLCVWIASAKQFARSRNLLYIINLRLCIEWMNVCSIIRLRYSYRIPFTVRLRLSMISGDSSSVGDAAGQGTNGSNPNDKNIKLSDTDHAVVIDKTPYTKVCEGKAEVLFPSSHDVFYNPVQEFNRDLSVAVIKRFLKMIPTMTKGLYFKLHKKDPLKQVEVSVLEALAASGLRSVRYAKEIKGLKKVVANDISKQAYESMLRNIKHNNVGDIVVPENEDATILMYKNRKKFDIIDLDPYGTPSPFLDAAVQSVIDGGLLMVTCTDMAILCGNGVEACHAKYGAVSMKIGCCHELALRIVLQCIESHANRYGRYIEPLLSVSVDFYVRIFVNIFTGPSIVKESICKLAMVYVCQGCTAYHFQPLGKEIELKYGQKYSPGYGPPVDKKCTICDSNFKVCGPIWISNLHNKAFVEGLLTDISMEESDYGTARRMLGMLNVIEEELDDCPLFHKVELLCSIMHTCNPTLMQFRSALLNSGYRISMSHCHPTSIKTDAPQSVIWDIVREWAKLNGGAKTSKDRISSFILNQPSSTKVSFEERPDANPASRSTGLLRFQVNPEPFWGPKARSKTSLFSGKEKDKQKRHQGKRKKKSPEEPDSTSSKKIKSDEEI